MQKNFIIYLNILFLTLCFSVNLPVIAHEHNDIHNLTKHVKPLKEGSVLTIQDCIYTGLKNSPIIKRQKYNLDIAKSNVGIAKSAFFPTLGVGAGINHQSNTNKEDFYSVYRELPNVNAVLNMMIWDFGRSSAKIRMEEFNKIAAEYEFEDSVCFTVFDIKIKYYNLLKALSLLQVENINSDINKQIALDISQLIKENKKNKIDLLNTQVEEFVIKNRVIEANREVNNSQSDLNNSIYYVNAPHYKILKTPTYKDDYFEKIKPISNIKLKANISKSDTKLYKLHFTLKEATDIAYKNNPDLKALIATKDAMEQALLVVKRSYYPSLNVNAGYDYINSNHYRNNSFSAGVNLNTDLNAMELKYNIDNATAQIHLAETEIEKFKQDLYISVEKALNNVEKTEKEISIAKQQAEKANENLQATITDYKNNKLTRLDMQNARELYIDALTDYINSIYNYNISLIKLEMSMHYHLVDLHEHTEHALEHHDDEIINDFDKAMKCKKRHSKKAEEL